MEKRKVYLDNNATTPIDKKVLAKMLPFFEKEFGNASTIYEWGRIARIAIENARKQIATSIGCSADEIIFTSGGTESDNLAIKGIAFANKHKGKHIITTSIEHHAVLNTCKYLESLDFDITYLKVDKNGIIDLNELKNAIKDDTILISIMYANNETGAIQPIKEIGQLIKEENKKRQGIKRYEVPFHTDAVQALGKIDIDVNTLNIDLLSISGHKINGPKGVGALYIRKGIKIEPLFHGGHQENRKRAGTENVPGIVGLGESCEIAVSNIKKENKHIYALKTRLYKGLKDMINEVYVNGDFEKSLANTLNISFKYVEGESIIMQLDFVGVAVTSGSACTSESLKSSHVLHAMGLDAVSAQGAIRFSFGKFNTEKDVDYVLEVLPPIIKKLREMSAISK